MPSEPTAPRSMVQSIVMPIVGCSYVGSDGCCQHKEALTPECHQWCACPRLRQYERARNDDRREQLIAAFEVTFEGLLIMVSENWSAAEIRLQMNEVWGLAYKLETLHAVTVWTDEKREAFKLANRASSEA